MKDKLNVNKMKKEEVAAVFCEILFVKVKNKGFVSIFFYFSSNFIAFETYASICIEFFGTSQTK